MFFIGLLIPLLFAGSDQYIHHHASKTHIYNNKNTFTPPDSEGYYYRHVAKMQHENGKWSKVVFYDSIPVK